MNSQSLPQSLKGDARASDRGALASWLDDGGSVLPILAKPARKRRAKQLADTVAGCRDRAAADLLTSSVMSTKNGQQRMEASAASWAARADLLQNMDDKFNARLGSSPRA